MKAIKWLRDDYNWIIPATVAGGLALMLSVWVVMSHMEAKSYNRVTGANVTTWEAMWVSLRVQAGPGER